MRFGFNFGLLQGGKDAGYLGKFCVTAVGEGIGAWEGYQNDGTGTQPGTFGTLDPDTTEQGIFIYKFVWEKPTGNFEIGFGATGDLQLTNRSGVAVNNYILTIDDVKYSAVWNSTALCYIFNDIALAASLAATFCLELTAAPRNLIRYDFREVLPGDIIKNNVAKVSPLHDGVISSFVGPLVSGQLYVKNGASLNTDWEFPDYAYTLECVIEGAFEDLDALGVGLGTFTERAEHRVLVVDIGSTEEYYVNGVLQSYPSVVPLGVEAILDSTSLIGHLDAVDTYYGYFKIHTILLTAVQVQNSYDYLQRTLTQPLQDGLGYTLVDGNGVPLSTQLLPERTA